MDSLQIAAEDYQATRDALAPSWAAMPGQGAYNQVASLDPTGWAVANCSDIDCFNHVRFVVLREPLDDCEVLMDEESSGAHVSPYGVYCPACNARELDALAVYLRGSQLV